MLSFFYLVFDMTSSCHPNKATYQDCGHQSMLSYLLSMLHQSLLAAPTTSRTRSGSNQTILTTSLCSRRPRPIADIITPTKGAPEVDPASTTCRYASAVLELNYPIRPVIPLMGNPIIQLNRWDLMHLLFIPHNHNYTARDVQHLGSGIRRK